MDVDSGGTANHASLHGASRLMAHRSVTISSWGRQLDELRTEQFQDVHSEGSPTPSEKFMAAKARREVRRRERQEERDSRRREMLERLKDGLQADRRVSALDLGFRSTRGDARDTSVIPALINPWLEDVNGGTRGMAARHEPALSLHLDRSPRSRSLSPGKVRGPMPRRSTRASEGTVRTRRGGRALYIDPLAPIPTLSTSLFQAESLQVDSPGSSGQRSSSSLPSPYLAMRCVSPRSSASSSTPCPSSPTSISSSMVSASLPSPLARSRLAPPAVDSSEITMGGEYDPRGLRPGSSPAQHSVPHRPKIHPLPSRRDGQASPRPRHPQRRMPPAAQSVQLIQPGMVCANCPSCHTRFVLDLPPELGGQQVWESGSATGTEADEEPALDLRRIRPEPRRVLSSGASFSNGPRQTVAAESWNQKSWDEHIQFRNQDGSRMVPATSPAARNDWEEPLLNRSQSARGARFAERVLEAAVIERWLQGQASSSFERRSRPQGTHSQAGSLADKVPAAAAADWVPQRIPRGGHANGSQVAPRTSERRRAHKPGDDGDGTPWAGRSHSHRGMPASVWDGSFAFDSPSAKLGTATSTWSGDCVGPPVKRKVAGRRAGGIPGEGAHQVRPGSADSTRVKGRDRCSDLINRSRRFRGQSSADSDSDSGFAARLQLLKEWREQRVEGGECSRLRDTAPAVQDAPDEVHGHTAAAGEGEQPAPPSGPAEAAAAVAAAPSAKKPSPSAEEQQAAPTSCAQAPPSDELAGPVEEIAVPDSLPDAGPSDPAKDGASWRQPCAKEEGSTTGSSDCSSNGGLRCRCSRRRGQTWSGGSLREVLSHFGRPVASAVAEISPRLAKLHASLSRPQSPGPGREPETCWSSKEQGQAAGGDGSSGADKHGEGSLIRGSVPQVDQRVHNPEVRCLTPSVVPSMGRPVSLETEGCGGTASPSQSKDTPAGPLSGPAGSTGEGLCRDAATQVLGTASTQSELTPSLPAEPTSGPRAAASFDEGGRPSSFPGVMSEEQRVRYLAALRHKLTGWFRGLLADPPPPEELPEAGTLPSRELLPPASEGAKRVLRRMHSVSLGFWVGEADTGGQRSKNAASLGQQLSSSFRSKGEPQTARSEGLPGDRLSLWQRRISSTQRRMSQSSLDRDPRISALGARGPLPHSFTSTGLTVRKLGRHSGRLSSDCAVETRQRRTRRLSISLIHLSPIDSSASSISSATHTSRTVSPAVSPSSPFAAAPLLHVATPGEPSGLPPPHRLSRVSSSNGREGGPVEKEGALPQGAVHQRSLSQGSRLMHGGPRMSPPGRCSTAEPKKIGRENNWSFSEWICEDGCCCDASPTDPRREGWKEGEGPCKHKEACAGMPSEVA